MQDGNGVQTVPSSTRKQSGYQQEDQPVEPLKEINITIQKAADGSDYVQIMSPAAMPVNIVLVADLVTVSDQR